jgi:hypothetical protein
MATPLIPQEIYLLERYTSLDYFGEMRDAWAAMVKLSYDALDAFVRKLPADYRSRPLYDQPDIVWGQRVIPNFQRTLDVLNDCFITISHGDMMGLRAAGGVSSDFKGFSQDHSSDWMDEAPVAAVLPGANDQLWKYLSRATERASNINASIGAGWTRTSLTTNYNPGPRGPLNPPKEWPLYRLNPKVRVKTDEPIPQSGIYLPDADDSCATFLIKGMFKDKPREAWPANVGRDQFGHAVSEVPTTWTLVERAADTGGGIPGEPDAVRACIRLRCEAGQPCPRAGFWFTPARVNSRRQFKAGEVMPDVGGDYGATIWQWDEQQGA